MSWDEAVGPRREGHEMSFECSICERDIRSGHDKTCPLYRDIVCRCGHHRDRHDEECVCLDCDCVYFELAAGPRREIV